MFAKNIHDINTIAIERSNSVYCPVGSGCRLHQLLLCRGVRPLQDQSPGYCPKQSDNEVPVMLVLWGMLSTPPLPLPLPPGPLWSGAVDPDRVLSVGQEELNCVLMLNWIVWNRSVSRYKNGLMAYNDWCTIKPNQTKFFFSSFSNYPQNSVLNSFSYYYFRTNPNQFTFLHCFRFISF